MTQQPATTAAAPREAAGPQSAPVCVVEDLGRMAYAPAWEAQRRAAELRKAGDAADRLLFVEHPPVITLGRNARAENLLLSEERLRALGVEVQRTNRGGDVTFHGPGQIVGYPILDLREWKKDVVAYVRAVEQVIIGALDEFGIGARRAAGMTGVWVDQGKVAAIGVHISRWVTSHGFALNVETDPRYFGYIVPCGLRKPVTSMKEILGEAPPRAAVIEALTRQFGCVFGRRMLAAGPARP